LGFVLWLKLVRRDAAADWLATSVALGLAAGAFGGAALGGILVLVVVAARHVTGR
jgi:hypothetical protein